MWAKRPGFTIVELLIVIVVIAILAAITIVAYNGLQSRAMISTAKHDLKSLGKQMEIFKIDHDAYPSAAEVPKTDLADILKKAGLYEATRYTDQAAWTAGGRPSKRFIFCTPGDNANRYAIVVDIPILNNSFSSVGKTTYYIDHTGAVKEMIFTESYPGNIGISLCLTATGYDASNWGAGWHAWSNGIPASWAP